MLSMGFILLKKSATVLLFRVEEKSAGIEKASNITNEVVSVFLAERYNREMPKITIIKPAMPNVPKIAVYAKNGKTRLLPLEATMI